MQSWISDVRRYVTLSVKTEMNFIALICSKSYLYITLICFLNMYMYDVICIVICVPGYFMSDFIRFWYAERPVNVMDFGRIRDKFYRHVHKLLKRSDCTLRTSFHKNT